MIEGTALGAFILVSLALLSTPGPAVAFVLARSLAGGPKAGIVSQAGLCAGLLVHVGAAALGLSAALAGSAAAFSTLRLLGSAYLVWLAFAAFRSGEPALPESGSTRGSTAGRLFLDGFLVDVLNPKPALFFLAFVPQFVDREAAGSAGLQTAGLGGLFVVLAFMTGSIYALLGGAASSRLRGSPGLRRWSGRITGTTYLALAVAAARVRR